jgi:exopolysaccharide biosynthesis WecB/TagA/CpsF family protein
MMIVHLAGLDFQNMDVTEAAAWIAARPAEGPFGYVVTPNADHLVRLNRDPRLSSLYREATLCLLDSRVVAAMAKMLGLAAPAVAAGSDVTVYLLEHYIHPADRLTVIGLSPDRLPALVARYRLKKAAHYNPPFGHEDDPAEIAAAVAFVQNHPARFVFLATGSPRQELLAAAIMKAGGATGTGLCIGASLEFLAGARRRAPMILRQAGLEWLFRLVCEPRRLWRRYLLDSPDIIRLLIQQRFG